MRSRIVPLTVSTVSLSVPNALRIAGCLGSMPAGYAALVYLFIVVSNLDPDRQRNIVSVGLPLESGQCWISLEDFQNAASAVGESLPMTVTEPPCEWSLRHVCVRLYVAR